MPAAKKVAWAQLRVGLMSMVALLLLALLIFLLTGAENPFEDKAVLYTYMNDSAALSEGSPVRLNGILIGKVKSVLLTGDKNNDRAIRMTLQVESRYLSLIPVDSEVSFSAENVLGTKFLNIKRGDSTETVKNGATLRARDETDFLELVQSAMPLLESVRSILSRMDRIVAQIESGQGSIGKLLYSEELYGRVNSVMADAQKVTKSVADGKGTFGKLLYDDSLYNELHRTVTRLDNLAEGLERGEGTAGKLLKDPALYDELKKSSAELNTLIADLNAGKGTAGKLLKDDAIANRILALADKLNATIDHINQGQGTIGQLMVNPALYESLTATSGELRSMLKDFRANPKKFLTIQLKLF
jgi:phospholipid/cholesterol/gamma-HCH transport system substrate-binding protein